MIDWNGPWDSLSPADASTYFTAPATVEVTTAGTQADLLIGADPTRVLLNIIQISGSAAPVILGLSIGASTVLDAYTTLPGALGAFGSVQTQNFQLTWKDHGTLVQQAWFSFTGIGNPVTFAITTITSPMWIRPSPLPRPIHIPKCPEVITDGF